MMAAEIVEASRRLGLTLRPAGDRIGVKPRSRLTADLRDQIRTHKTEVLALLNGTPCGYFWGFRPVGLCARCGAPYRSHLVSLGIVPRPSHVEMEPTP